MKKHLLLLTISGLIACSSTNKKYPKLEQQHWVVEQQPGGNVLFTSNSIEINDDKGCTLWLKEKLYAPVCIEYDAYVIDNGGPNDRVSDLNCFWMANDPKSPKDFFANSKQRAGKFTNYHLLSLYYVGLGGHNNSKTRFRRYNATLNRPLLKEHDLAQPEVLITPNTNIHIKIEVKNGETTYSKDGEVLFRYSDTTPLTSGYFGFRTVKNHMSIRNFSIRQLPPPQG